MRRDDTISVSIVQEQNAELGPAERVALARTASKTGVNSPGELLMTRSTSEVAVCCSSDSLNSRVAAR